MERKLSFLIFLTRDGFTLLDGSALLNLQNCIKVFLEAVGELPELLSLYNNYDTYLKLGEEFKEKEDKRCVDRQPQISFSQKKICLEHVFFSYPEMSEKCS